MACMVVGAFYDVWSSQTVFVVVNRKERERTAVGAVKVAG